MKGDGARHDKRKPSRSENASDDVFPVCKTGTKRNKEKKHKKKAKKMILAPVNTRDK